MSSAEPDNGAMSFCRHCRMSIMWTNNTWLHFLSHRRECAELPPVGFGKAGKVSTQGR